MPMSLDGWHLTPAEVAHHARSIRAFIASRSPGCCHAPFNHPPPQQRADCIQMTEREQLLTDALENIAEWVRAYPPDVFPPPDAAYHARAAAVLEANGMTLDRLSAAAMRHVVTQVGEIAQDALNNAKVTADGRPA
jgi:hypothetical protein